MDWKLEVVPIPVSDIDRAKSFYGEQVGFAVDHDTQAGPGTRFVQLTPPGSACSIVLGVNSGMPPGSVQGVQIVVPDIEAARAQLAERGVAVSPVQHFGADGALADGHGGRWNAFVFFSDPDGNGWVLQERPADDQAT
ncbi:VOC family protein [Planotetraspora phitsanulokensis]|uniref:Glyoxalase n=1 Tax=Planotetraspora phitsanulokensis TaxID=575192 RepID=A0A8J3U9U5_9ACTN|nr:VOC family protein [Planotetraspora phitsanulokensis]GII41409.1 glyoxalase [Planotetraspora phitsanulokensis]